MTSKQALYLTIALLFGILFQTSCTPESQQVDPRILGKWTLLEGWRNNRPSPSLENIAFEFFADGNMRSNFNFNGSSEAGIFELKENMLHQRNGQIDVDYAVESLSDSIMILSTNLMDADFRLLLKKQASDQ